MDGQTDTARKPRRQKCRLKKFRRHLRTHYLQTATHSNPNRLGNQYERLFTYLPAFTNRYRFNRFP
ncbi:hypothetical protein NEIPOLOT_01165 [Neisseria polysaccharea ATCC 43768]|nr:hypothetical protein NEIPOLOT_01165 [Neisseria polysaccharea ATCC 43768]